MVVRAALCFLLALAAAIVPAKAAELGGRFVRHHQSVSGSSLQRQADQGSSRAQAVLCLMYLRGQGVPQDYQDAAYWCGRAADQGNPEGQYLLGLMYDKGQGVPASSPRAYIWLNLAAAHVSGNRRDLFYRIRDSVATKMTPDQVTVAQRVAVEWTPTAER